MAQYGIFFTQIGRDKIASATEGNPLDITHIAVGDGGGGYPAIDDSVTSLVNELGRYPINGTSTPAPTQRQFSAVVPPELGPAVIRERGLIDSDGDLIAIAQAEPIEMPAPGPNAVSVTVGILATFNNADYVRAIVDLQGFVRTTRKVNAGTGTKGGGDLSHDVTISADFALQAEAEDEQNLTKVMSPRRTWQAIAKWYDSKFSTFIKTMLGRTSAAQVRNDLQLKSAALRDVGTEAGNVMEVGAFGLGVQQGSDAVDEFTPSVSGFYSGGISTRLVMARASNRASYLEIMNDGARRVSAFIRHYNPRSGEPFSPKQELHHTGNILSSTGSSTKYPMSQKAVTDALEAAGTDWKEDIATEEEARNPTIDDKVMTPKKVFKAIDRWSPERAWGAYVTRNWKSAPEVEDNSWNSVTWSPELGLFVAVASSGTNRVMTSTDGINWTARQAAESNRWHSVTWSPELGLFVAVAGTGTNRVMTSTDGINWTARQAAESNQWRSVTWSPELGLFVAVSWNGTNQVMTSTDGINWTGRQAAEQNEWNSVTWSPELGLFVAVAGTGTNRVMTSTDGINWTGRQAAEQNEWLSVTWSPELGMFVAVSYGGTNQVMTSPDGINWTGRQAAEYNGWYSVTWSPELGLFVAVASNGIHRVMTSPDGINWTGRQAAEDNNWYSVTWSPELGLFVAVSWGTTSTNLVMHTI